MPRAKKISIRKCGNCNWCGKELLSNMGGWIINAERKHFCHGIDHTCFDEYLTTIKSTRENTKPNANFDKLKEIYIEYLKRGKCLNNKGVYATKR